MVEGFYSFTRLRTDYCSFFQAWLPGRSPSPCAHMGSEDDSSRAGLGPPSTGLAQARHQQVVRKGGQGTQGCGLELPGEDPGSELAGYLLLVLGKQGTFANSAVSESPARGTRGLRGALWRPGEVGHLL